MFIFCFLMLDKLFFLLAKPTYSCKRKTKKKYIQTNVLNSILYDQNFRAKNTKKHSPNHDHKIKEIIKRNSNMPVLKKVIKNMYFFDLIIRL